MKIIALALAFASVGFVSMFSPLARAAGTASLSLSPSSQSVNTGSNLVLNVTLNTSGSSVNTIQSQLSYPSANFSLVSVTPVAPFDGAFPAIITSTSGSNNLVEFAAGTTSAFSGTQNVVTVTLRANTAGSSLPVTLASVCAAGNYALNCSAAYDASTSVNDLSTVNGGSYTVSTGTVPTVNLSANPTTINSGQNSTLTWTSTNATSCSATSPSGWTSSTATSGTQSVSPTTTTTYQMTCTGPGGTSSPASATVTVNLQTGCYQSSTSWQNTSFTTQTANFSVDFDATPGSSGTDGVIGLNNSPAAAYTDLAAIVRFNTSGFIDVMNGAAGDTYQSAVSTPYTSGTSYHFKLSINPSAHTYSVVVTPAGGSAVNIATNYSFRSTQATLSTFSNWALIADPGPQQVCNIQVTGSTTVVGDINKDGHVTVIDLSLLLSSYGSPASACVTNPSFTCDINGSGGVTIVDLSILLSHFGT